MNLPTEYQSFIYLSRYSRWLEEEGRRETWDETVNRLIVFFRNHVENNLGVKDQLDDKDYTCPICDKTLDPEGFRNGRIWHVDHCHTTGKFRGHLCPTCNTGIGHLRDDPTLVRNALKYLEDFYAKENE